MKLKKKYKIVLIILILFALGLLLCLGFYSQSLFKVSNDEKLKTIDIQKGSTTFDIANILKDNNLIKNKKTFILYVKLNKINDLKFGIYSLSENMGTKKIVNLLREGSKINPNEVVLTIKEGINMREIARSISNVTNNSYEDVLKKSNDINYINKLKDKYWFITDSINNNNLYYKLEGYLYPDTYRLTNKDVSVEYIFDKMLDEMNSKLIPYKNKKCNLNIHEILSLASMIQKESGFKKDMKDISSVFYNRLNSNMSLGSDVTTRYALKIDNPNKTLSYKDFNYKSPYNTRLLDGSMHGKLPIGPISTVSIDSIDAAYNPNKTNNIYFIANIKTKETFFYDNSKEFEQKKIELKNINGGH